RRPAGPIVPARRGGSGLRRRRAADVRPAALPAPGRAGFPVRLRPARVERPGSPPRADRDPQAPARNPAAGGARGPTARRACFRAQRRRVPARLQDGSRGHRLEAARLVLPLRPLAGLAQDEEPGGAGGEAGSGGGLGTLIAPAGTFSAASHKTSTLRSPAFASSISVLAIISSLRSARRFMAAPASSNATPRRRVVSGSKVWPCKKDLMGTKTSPSKQN